MHMKTRPLHPRFGVEISGVDLSDVTADLFAAIRAAFEDHSLLLIRDQSLDDAAHMRLARLFGPIEDRNADERAPDQPFEVPQVSNIAPDGSTVDPDDLHALHLKANMLWHSDSTFMPTPALANILVARVVTKTGGQTEFASTRAGWDDLPEPLKSETRHRAFWHRYAHSRAQISPELAALPMFHKWPDQLWNAVWRNPVNGREALYIASHAHAVEGMDSDSGAALIESLLKYVTRPEYVFSHTWNVGDVLVWDQRAVLHRARPWNTSEPRKLSSLCVSVTENDGIEDMKPDRASDGSAVTTGNRQDIMPT